MCAPSPPPAPDPAAMASAQGAANEAAARQQGIMNNPNVFGPGYGRTVTFGPDGQPTITTTLSPDEAKVYENMLYARKGLGQLADQGVNSLQGVIGTGVNLNGLPGELHSYTPAPGLDASSIASGALNPNGLPSAGTAYKTPTDLPAMPGSAQSIRDQVINAMMGRANIDIGKQQDQQTSDLIAAGIHPGTKAYSDAQDMIARQRNDALQQAQLAGSTAAQQAYQQDLQTRQEAQNEAIQNQTTTFGQQQQLRSQAAQEAAQRFGELGQASQLGGQQQQQGMSQADQLRRQAIAELLTQRETPLNEISALMSGSQVGNPFTGGTPMSSGGSPVSVAPAPIFGAMQQQGQYNTDVYNQQVGTANSQQAAGAAIVAAAIAAF